ncbi:MAG TPA: YraN family protein [Ruminiclostridium sp.]|nr:YraN family protein [Ruminiclostridium sp.]
MTDFNKRGLGAEGEKEAAEFLKKNGYTVLKTNYRVGRIGEIDIIAMEKEYICFIEVKTRRSSAFGTPGEAVTLAKQKKIRQLAAIYLSNTGETNKSIRFDVVEIIMDKAADSENRMKSLNLIKNAF